MKEHTIRVLVVDDEEDLELLVRQKFRRRIRGGELEFMFAGNGKEGLEKLQENPDVHLVLSDINMPVMDGLTMLCQLADADLDVQAVIVSAYGDMENIRTAMNRGAFDFLTKPIDFNDLEITIEKGMRHVRSLQAALESRDKLVSINRELELASQVQMSTLPKDLPANSAYDVSALIYPAREVGGDFYDFFHIDESHLGLVIADVSGKGVPAALFAMVTRALLKATLREYESPAASLDTANKLLCEDNNSFIFITLFFGVLDTSNGNLLYANAGHNPPRLLRGDSRVEVVVPTENLVLGIDSDHEYRNNEMHLKQGDALIMYTDGITEAENTSKEEFGEALLDETLKSLAGETAKQISSQMVAAVREFAGDAQQSDDITCLTAQLLSLPS